MRRIALTAGAIGLLVGCAPTQVDVSFEEDGVELVQLDDGTNPAPEVFYEGGGWRIDTECNESIEPTGNDIGDVTAGTAVVDQFGDTVNIHDFCGRAILLVSGSFT